MSRMNVSPVNLPCVLLCLFSGATEALGAPRVLGEAWSLRDQSLAYREYHYSGEGDGGYRVDYRSGGGKPVASKAVDYTSGFITPSLFQLDKRTGEAIRISRADSSVNVEYRERETAEFQQRSFPVPDALVIDAGFDYFIRQNWERLLSGGRLDFAFPVPSRLELMDFQLQRIRCADLELIHNLSNPDTATVCLQIAPANLLLRWLAQPIELVYSAENPRLLVYRGLSNIADEKGSGQQVEIHYSYQQISFAGGDTPN